VDAHRFRPPRPHISSRGVTVIDLAVGTTDRLDTHHDSAAFVPVRTGTTWRRGHRTPPLHWRPHIAALAQSVRATHS